MKKLLSIALIAMIMLFLIGCGDSYDTESELFNIEQEAYFYESHLDDLCLEISDISDSIDTDGQDYDELEEQLEDVQYRLEVLFDKYFGISP